MLASLNSTVLVFNWKNRTIENTLSTYSRTGKFLRLLPDGIALVPSIYHAPIYGYSIPSATICLSLNTDEISIEKLTNGFLATSGNDMKIKIWDLSTGKMVMSFQTNEHQYSMKQTHIGNYLASGASSGNIYIWNLDDGSLIRTLIGHRNFIINLRMLGNGKLISGGNDGYLRIWDILTGTCLDKMTPFISTLLTFIMLNGNTLLAGTYANNFYILEVNATNQLNRIGSVSIPGSYVNDFGLTGEDILLVSIVSNFKPYLLYYNKTNFKYMANISMENEIWSIETSRFSKLLKTFKYL